MTKKTGLDKNQIADLAQQIGFDICRFADAAKPWDAGDSLKEFITANHHGEMVWIETTFERRKHPTNMWNDAKTAIMLGTNYGSEIDPLDALKFKDQGAISVYAQNDDYHDLIKKRLKQLAGEIHRQLKCEVKVFVDTAPLMEKPLAAQAGIGWQGKHTNLVSREFGSWLFLGAILIAHEIEPDEAEIDHCGSCTSCIDICPTGAIIAPYKIDARRCISYLTIEYDGEIEPELMDKMGNHIYGCDDCLAICPWNKFATPTKEAAFKPRDAAIAPKLAELAKLNDESFREMFKKSPIKRIGINKFLRNVLIAIGNSENKSLAISAKELVQHENQMVRNAALRAIAKLGQ